MIMKIAVLVAALFVSCGADDKSTSSAPATPAPWSDAFHTSFVDGCVSDSLKASPTPTKSAAQAYCVCVAEELQKKYSEADFKAHASECSEKAKTDGTIATCKARAGL